jgi:hypothetical protein
MEVTAKGMFIPKILLQIRLPVFRPQEKEALTGTTMPEGLPSIIQLMPIM